MSLYNCTLTPADEDSQIVVEQSNQSFGTKYVGAEIFNSRWTKFCFDDISEVVESYGPCVPSVKTDIGGYETKQVALP